MSNNKKNEFNDFSEKLDELIDNNELNIGSIEDLMINSINNYKNELINHVEELLSQHINEKDLVTKKNKNGKKKDLN